MRKERNKLAGVLFTIGGGICWGISGSIGQYLFQYEGMHSKWLVPVRLGIAGVLLLAFCISRYGLLILEPWRDPRDRRDLLIYGCFGVSLCQFFYFTTIMLSNAAMGTILQDLAPIFVLIYSCVKNKRRPTAKELASIHLAIIGVLLISTHGNIHNLRASMAAILTGVLSAFGVMVYNVAPLNLMKKYPVFILQSWAFLLGGIGFSLLFKPWSFHYKPTLMGWAGILAVVIIGNIIAYPLYVFGVHLIGPEKGVLYGFSEPISAAIIGILLFCSPFTGADALGFLMVFAMLYLISKS